MRLELICQLDTKSDLFGQRLAMRLTRLSVLTMPSVTFLDLIGTSCVTLKNALCSPFIGYRVHPRSPRDTAGQREELERAQTIPSKQCEKDRPWCGYPGEDIKYEHEPMTAFQKWCREEPSKDLQQYTETDEAIKVLR
jgi:hypothetical protein